MELQGKTLSRRMFSYNFSCSKLLVLFIAHNNHCTLGGRQSGQGILKQTDHTEVHGP